MTHREDLQWGYSPRVKVAVKTLGPLNVSANDWCNWDVGTSFAYTQSVQLKNPYLVITGKENYVTYYSLDIAWIDL